MRSLKNVKTVLSTIYLESNWKIFLSVSDAAQRYIEISFKSIVDASERLEALKMAIACAILAGAGQQRSRILATLYKDERSQQLSSFPILEKMYLERIIKRDEQLQQFESSLLGYYDAKLPWKTSIKMFEFQTNNQLYVDQDKKDNSFYA